MNIDNFNKLKSIILSSLEELLSNHINFEKYVSNGGDYERDFFECYLENEYYKVISYITINYSNNSYDDEKLDKFIEKNLDYLYLVKNKNYAVFINSCVSRLTYIENHMELYLQRKILNNLSIEELDYDYNISSPKDLIDYDYQTSTFNQIFPYRKSDTDYKINYETKMENIKYNLHIAS